MNKDYEFDDLVICLKEYEMSLLSLKCKNTQTVEISDILKKRIKRLIRKYNEKSFVNRIMRNAVAIIAMIILFTAVIRPQIYVNAANRIVEWLDTHIHIQFFTDSLQSSESEYEITYLPEGYFLKEVQGEDGEGKIFLYENDNGKTIEFFYEKSNSSLNINNEGVKYSTFKDSNNHMVYYMEKTTAESSSMTWLSEDKRMVFTLFSSESEDEMKKIINSIKEIP